MIIGLSKEFWIASFIIGLMRKMNGDSFRHTSQSRGDNKNLLNDIQGAAGELILLKRLSEFEVVEDLHHDILDIENVVDDVDFTYRVFSTCSRVDVKCHFLDDSKRLFLINQEAHKKATGRRTTFYCPIITRQYATDAYIGMKVYPDEVDKWDQHDFKYGAPAFGVSLIKLSSSRFLVDYNEICRSIGTLSDFSGYETSILEGAILKKAAIVRRLILEKAPKDHGAMKYNDLVQLLWGVALEVRRVG